MIGDPVGLSVGRPDHVALVGGGRRWTYAELDREVERRASEDFAGLDPGTPHPCVLESDAEGVLALLALWRREVVPVPVPPTATAAEREALEDSLVDAHLPPGTQAVLWTSGTSGRPRGVALRWAALEHVTRASADRLQLSNDDVWLASLSLAHVGGLALAVRALLLGGTLVADGRMSAEQLSDHLDGLDRRGASVPPPTQLSLVPTQLRRLLHLRRDRGAPDALRCVLVGGAHAPGELVRAAIAAGWPLALTYGATEATSQIATATPAETAAGGGTVGLPLPGVEVEVTSAGELRVRGPTLAAGYVGVDVGPLTDAEGWYRTGDLGRWTENGRLVITGRRIDRIVTGGVTVDAIEIEDALRAHASVEDACVVGIPDEEWGERVCAWVEPATDELDVETLAAHLRGMLSGSKLPRRWILRVGLPRNANGKVDRAAVRSALEDSA